MIRCAKISEIPDILTITRACAKKCGRIEFFNGTNTILPVKLSPKTLSVGSFCDNRKQCRSRDYRYINFNGWWIRAHWMVDPKWKQHLHSSSFRSSKPSRPRTRTKMMDFAEAFSKENGFVSVRLDTFSQNKRNQLFTRKGVTKNWGYLLSQTKRASFSLLWISAVTCARFEHTGKF